MDFWLAAGSGLGGEAQPHRRGLAGTDGEPVVGGHLGSGLLGVHCFLLAQHHAVVDAVFDVWGLVGRAENALVVGFVVGKEQRHLALAVEGVLTH